MIYYNQRDYAHIPYPAPGYESATVATSGCGPVCFAMLVSNLLKKAYTVEESVQFAKNCGARVPGGTDLNILGKASEKLFGLKFSVTKSMDAALSALRYKKAMCIANVGASNLFSDSGHYVLMVEEGPVYISVLDPYLYYGKFNKEPRKGKVIEVDGVCYVKPEYFEEDVKGYYIFERTADMNTNEAIKVLKDKGIINSPNYWLNAVQVVKYLDELLIKMAGEIK